MHIIVSGLNIIINLLYGVISGSSISSWDC